ncbi:Carboxylesterase [Lipomyces oligophaga]|uniref:Carboxylesterase n=1 Tax=Lipomyces oligophaga TaxID=45792 RepID=UPI0034CDD2B5
MPFVFQYFVYLWLLLIRDVKAKYTCSGPSCTVSTSTGNYRGLNNSDGIQFLSIRYAQPPLENLKFADPVSFLPSASMIYDATQLPPFCIQGNYANESEDCLYLNVFRPKQNSYESSLPVMVWVHGGSFTEGGSADPVIYGAYLANTKGVIVVTMNYRLGLWGLFDDGNSTNFALKDILLALDWVKQNIQYFNGDASSVTLAGQSSGATAVRAMLSSSKAVGLFKYAILQSDPMNYGWYPRETSAYITSLVYNQTGCFDLDCMRTLSTSAILSAQEYVLSCAPTLKLNVSYATPLSPIIDENILMQDFSVYLENDNLPVQVPIMIGTVKNESNHIIEGVLPSPVPVSYYSTVLAEFLGNERADEVVETGLFAPSESADDSTRICAAYFSGLFYWTCPVEQNSVKLASLLHNKVYLYEFRLGMTYPNLTSLSMCEFPNVCHESDLYPLFGTYSPMVMDSRQKRLAAEVQERWTSFMSTGSPNSSKYPLQWSPVDSSSKLNLLMLGREKTRHHMYEEECAVMGTAVKYDYQLYSQ